MASATVTSKGQVTIPVDVRTKLGLRPGSRLAFVPTDTGGYEIHPEAASIKDLKGTVPRLPRPVSVDEMNEAIAAAATADAR
jgi:antitoxin PrlF